MLEAARVVGAGRFVTQSLITGYGYLDHGDRELTEEDPFGQPRGTYGDPVVEGCRSTEEQALRADGIALRYGMFYGPHAFSDMFAEMMRKHLPILPAGGGGTTSWIHVADAAHHTPRPKAMPRWLLKLSAPYLACLMADTSMRVSHAKATRELGWTPSRPSIHEGLERTGN